MNKIAIDVVLLPSPEVAKRAIQVSAELARVSGNTKIVLDDSRVLPHISLCMGVVDESDLPEVEHILNDVSEQFDALTLEVQGPVAVPIPTNERIAVLPIQNTHALQQLHETIMARLKHLITEDAEREMFVEPHNVEQISCTWVNGYSEAAFFPHITVGFDEVNASGFPAQFKATKLAVCHLGNYCTCRKKLFDLTLHEA